MSDALRSGRLARGYYKVLERRILPGFLRWGVTPNHVTIAGTLIAVWVPVGFYGHPALGLILLLLSAVADSLDGLLARALHRDSPFGALLDSSLDRLSDGLYLIGFWTLFLPLPNQALATALMFTAVLLTLMISYLKARAESLAVACGVGFMERGMRVLYLIAWSLLLIFLPQARPDVLWVGLWLYIGLTLATVVQRFVHIQKQLFRG